MILSGSCLKTYYLNPQKKEGVVCHTRHARNVLNTQLYVLITGCRWCDIPRGEQWASKSAAHRWLKRWYEDGTLEKLKERILAVAEEKGIIDWKYGAVDGSFSPA